MNTLLPHNASIDSRKFLDAVKYGQYGTGRRVMLGRFNFLYWDRKYREACKITHAFADQYVDKAIDYRKALESAEKPFTKDEGSRRYLFLNELAQETGNKTEIRDQLLNVFLAGHDSTAVVLSHLFFSLSRNNAVWEKLRAEVIASGPGKPTFDTLKEMTYLRYCINESWFPPPSMLNYKLHRLD